MAAFELQIDFLATHVVRCIYGGCGNIMAAAIMLMNRFIHT